MPNRTPLQVSFSFTQKDTAATDALLTKIKAAGLKARRGTVIRALLTLTSETALFNHAVAHARANLLNASAAHDPITDHPPVDLPQAVIDSLDRVVSKLARARVIGSRSYLLRTLVRATAPDDRFVKAFGQYLADNPYKPRGLSKLRAEGSRKPV